MKISYENIINSFLYKNIIRYKKRKMYNTYTIYIYIYEYILLRVYIILIITYLITQVLKIIFKLMSIR